MEPGPRRYFIFPVFIVLKEHSIANRLSGKNNPALYHGATCRRMDSDMEAQMYSLRWKNYQGWNEKWAVYPYYQRWARDNFLDSRQGQRDNVI